MLVLAGIAYAVTPLVDKLTLSWFVHDLNSRSSLIANTIQEPLVELLAVGRRIKILEFLNRITQGGRVKPRTDRALAVPAAIRVCMISLHCNFTTLICLNLRQRKALRHMKVPILIIYSSLCLTLVPAHRRAGGRSRSSYRPGSHPMGLTPRNTPQLRLGTARGICLRCRSATR